VKGKLGSTFALEFVTKAITSRQLVQVAFELLGNPFAEGKNFLDAGSVLGLFASVKRRAASISNGTEISSRNDSNVPRLFCIISKRTRASAWGEAVCSIQVGSGFGDR
jgi:hypothetical protein